MSANNCLFCRIAAREIPAGILYEDEEAIAFRDINPQAPTHLLVIPRAHVASLDEAAAEADETITPGEVSLDQIRIESALGHLLRVAARVAQQEGISASGYRTVINTGADAGQSVAHLHVHVLGGRALNWPPG